MHEIGHFFSLYHTFQSTGDLVADILEAITGFVGGGGGGGAGGQLGGIISIVQGVLEGAMDLDVDGDGELDAISAAWICQSLIVVVNRHREDAFRVSLPDDIIIKNIADFLRRRHAFFRFKSGGFVFLTDDIHTELNAFITDEDGWTRNQLFDFVLALPAERAIKRIL